VVTYFPKINSQIVCNHLYKNICGKIFCLGGGRAKLQNFDTIDLGKNHWLKYGILDEIKCF